MLRGNVAEIRNIKTKNVFLYFFSFLVQIAKGLNHCHNQLIAHLDIKPSNILVTSTGQCKLADFGCSMRFKTAHENKSIEICPGTPGKHIT